jgi:hypothetical protein
VGLIFVEAITRGTGVVRLVINSENRSPLFSSIEPWAVWGGLQGFVGGRGQGSEVTM